MIKPSLSLSKGRLAFSGSSFLVDSAFIALNPPIPIEVMQDSVPPAIIASASPRWMTLNASPMAWLPVAQAVAGAEFGPFAPNFMDICPAARLIISIGIKKGVILRGPFSSNTLW